jgi:hypothetical protein
MSIRTTMMMSMMMLSMMTTMMSMMTTMMTVLLSISNLDENSVDKQEKMKYCVNRMTQSAVVTTIKFM